MLRFRNGGFGPIKKEIVSSMPSDLVAEMNKPTKTAIAQPPVVKKIPVTAKQIHDELFASTDEALSLLKEKSKGIFMSPEKIALAQKLKEAGFTSTPLYTTYEGYVSKKVKLEANIAVVEKYQQKYPQYKFVFRKDIENICKKYGLLCAEAGYYKMDIPEKNIEEIASFKVDSEDTWSIAYSYSEYGNRRQLDVNNLTELSGEYQHISRYPFFICAKPDEFQRAGTKVVDSVYLVDKDPIVLHWLPEGYLIVSKWGDEANIAEIVNEKNN